MKTTVNGVDTYIYTGTKPVQPRQPSVLFIHGAANDHSVWALQSRYFAYRGWNVIAPDLPGHGQSQGPCLDSVDAMAQWCDALLQAVGVAGEAKLAVVGHSMGSLIALALAARSERRCTHLALLGSAAPMGVSDVLLDAARDTPDLAYKMIVNWSFAPVAHIGGNKAPGIWMVGQSLALMGRSGAGVLHADLQSCKSFGDAGVALAARLSGQVLCLSANRDLMTPAKSLAPLIAALRANGNVTLTTHVLEECGHSMMSERPEEVLMSLKAFFQ